jgi:hypothetical protein
MKAKEINFNPCIRVLVPAGGDDTHNETELAKLIAYDTIINWTKEEILEWIFDFSAEPIDSPDKYDCEYDNN